MAFRVSAIFQRNGGYDYYQWYRNSVEAIEDQISPYISSRSVMSYTEFKKLINKTYEEEFNVKIIQQDSVFDIEFLSEEDATMFILRWS